MWRPRAWQHIRTDQRGSGRTCGATAARPTQRAHGARCDIGAYQRTDPDPFDTENFPEQSNPNGLAIIDGANFLVADAANNDLLHITKQGSIETVGTVPAAQDPVSIRSERRTDRTCGGGPHRGCGGSRWRLVCFGAGWIPVHPRNIQSLADCPNPAPRTGRATTRQQAGRAPSTRPGSRR